MNRKRPGRMLRRLGQVGGGMAQRAYRLGRRRLGLANRPEIYYVAPDINWVLDWVGRYVTESIRRDFGVPAHRTSAPRYLVDHVLHYGSLWSFLDHANLPANRHNQVVATIFHADRSARFPGLAEAADRFITQAGQCRKIVTACRIMEDRLLAWGLPRGQVVRIPLGVDLGVFHPLDPAGRSDLRRSLGIPEGAFCIGSFQKDGDGWEQGLQPKLIKGPDIFLKTIDQLRGSVPLFVLLSAPARGYVKQGLERMGVAYRHILLPHFHDIARLYPALDAYLMASREEGGPQAVLEAMACGVPLVSTRAGLAPDVIGHGRTGLLAEIEDADTLACHLARLAEDEELGRVLAENALQAVVAYNWADIAARYFHEVYAPLLADFEPPARSSST